MEKKVIDWLLSQPGFGKDEFNVRVFLRLLVVAMSYKLLKEAGMAKRISDLTGMNIKTVRKYLK